MLRQHYGIYFIFERFLQRLYRRAHTLGRCQTTFYLPQNPFQRKQRDFIKTQGKKVSDCVL